MPPLECHACSAALPPAATRCPRCGAIQNAGAAAARAVREARASAERWKIAAIASSIFTLAFGVGAGAWLAAPAPASNSSVLQTSSAGRLSIAQVNDAFMRHIDEEFEIGFAGWLNTPDGTVVFEMYPPSPTYLPLWQRLAPDARYGLMALISVAYTRARATGGYAPDLEREGHPQIAISYRGAGVLALRRRDGSIEIYPSPYDQVTDAADAAPTPR